jgi:hypothetical protein
MKTSSAPANPEPLSVQTARGCVGTNLALPGFGSLMAKRPAGWPQAALTVVGFLLTMIFGVQFVVWALRNMSNFYDPQSDPIETFAGIWLRLRWPLLGFGMVAISWLWTLNTNAAILRSAKHAAEPGKPPKLC